jgi:hypothetical protein
MLYVVVIEKEDAKKDYVVYTKSANSQQGEDARQAAAEADAAFSISVGYGVSGPQVDRHPAAAFMDGPPSTAT